MHIFIKSLLVKLILFAILGACQSSLPEDTTASDMTEERGRSEAEAAPSPRLVTSAESKAVPAGITGVVISESDVGNQPDIPLTEQPVVAISVDAMDFLQDQFSGSLSAEDLRFLSVTFDQDGSGLIRTLTDSSGRYNLALEPGAYFLCLADSTGPAPLDLPLTTRGCGPVTVQPGMTTTLNISSGFGEILLVEP